MNKDRGVFLCIDKACPLLTKEVWLALYFIKPNRERRDNPLKSKLKPLSWLCTYVHINHSKLVPIGQPCRSCFIQGFSQVEDPQPLILQSSVVCLVTYNTECLPPGEKNRVERKPLASGDTGRTREPPCGRLWSLSSMFLC